MLPVKKASSISTHQPVSPSNRVHIFIILLAAGCLTTMTGGVVSPVFPEMMQELRFDPKWAGMLVSAHALASALSTPVMGIVADRLGKLRVLIPALGLYAVFGMSGAFITNFSLLLAMRVLLGVASGGIAAASIGLLGWRCMTGRSRVAHFGIPPPSGMTTASIIIPVGGG
ncbi:MAG: MFS transporter, partial [Leptolyngbyaceae cyanobacterium SL_7_1]|nr:MFS transporter [Leptolyngbyaceae cyanobacterium SL_7_1]